MKAGTFRTPLFEYRFQARQLLKHLRSNDAEASSMAAARFLRLQSFSDRTVSQVLEDRDRVQLKHALAIVALEQGHDSWLALKASAEAKSSSVGTEVKPPDVAP